MSTQPQNNDTLCPRCHGHQRVFDMSLGHQIAPICNRCNGTGRVQSNDTDYKWRANTQEGFDEAVEKARQAGGGEITLGAGKFKFPDILPSNTVIRGQQSNVTFRVQTNDNKDPDSVDIADVWKTIPGQPDYEASSTGKIRKLSSDAVDELKQFQVTHGYKAVNLKNGGLHIHAVHRLVAKAFVPNPDNKPNVNHLNGDKEDNDFKNLEWVDQHRNINHYHANNHDETTCRVCLKYKEHVKRNIEHANLKASVNDTALDDIHTLFAKFSEWGKFDFKSEWYETQRVEELIAILAAREKTAYEKGRAELAQQSIDAIYALPKHRPVNSSEWSGVDQEVVIDSINRLIRIRGTNDPQRQDRDV